MNCPLFTPFFSPFWAMMALGVAWYFLLMLNTVSLVLYLVYAVVCSDFFWRCIGWSKALSAFFLLSLRVSLHLGSVEPHRQGPLRCLLMLNIVSPFFHFMHGQAALVGGCRLGCCRFYGCFGAAAAGWLSSPALFLAIFSVMPVFSPPFSWAALRFFRSATVVLFFLAMEYIVSPAFVL